jgi:hypothetical protein
MRKDYKKICLRLGAIKWLEKNRKNWNDYQREWRASRRVKKNLKGKRVLSYMGGHR